jgi:hypothetical protein
MRSDIVPGGTFPDYARNLSRPGLREAWAAGDLSHFHGWDRLTSNPPKAT